MIKDVMKTNRIKSGVMSRFWLRAHHIGRPWLLQVFQDVMSVCVSGIKDNGIEI